ncbi:Helicase associated domain protein [Streptomyces sp. C10-9-1]|uniref:helicase associated domain-containing protein n=1 Tax=Streptomyces sp. C10-9-1 TaxID=1859285 RepID=UPI003D7062C8
MIRQLRPYQKDAVDALAEGLADGGRGQLHAACGSGKTLISALTATRLVPGSGLTVVFTPSLALVAQTLQEWRTLHPADAVLAVCSDDTVTDAPAHLGDISEQTTTSVDEIHTWLQRTTGRRLVVATYLSAHRLAEALRTAGTAADLAVHDEAHHLAGQADAATRRILHDAFLPARRRLFMTATPRIDDALAEVGAGLSMSDETVFGPVLYSYPWARAITEGHLDDYRVVIMGVTQRQMLDLLNDDQHQHVETPGAPDLRTLAAQTVLAQAARQYGLRRVLAFCHRLDTAQEFARSLPSTLARLAPHARPEGQVHAERIAGTHTHAQRKRILDTLRNPPGAWTVLANVRCLSEGVDVPAVDAVLFTHPKTSQVDIVQAVGRALRRSHTGQSTATVIVPIVVPDSAEEVGDLEPGDFRTLWQVLRALRAHDESLGIELDTHRSYESVVNPQLPSRITVQLPPGSTNDLLGQLTALTVRQTTSSWWTGYGHARAYRDEHGSLAVPLNHTTADGFRLGQWIANARHHRRKGWLRPRRIEALDDLGMVWDTRDAAWHRLLDELRAFRREFGHTLVPQAYTTPTGYRLGSKINQARSSTRRIPDSVRRALDDLGMVWDTRDLQWQQLYTACQEYAAEHGHLDVPGSYTTPDGYGLGQSLKRIRRADQLGRLDQAERASLDELGMVWRTVSGDERAWNHFLAACDRYIAEHGSLATVQKSYVDPTGYRLGARISYYRNLHHGTKAGNIPPQRREALDGRGMVWRIAPVRDLSPDEHATLRELTGPDLGTAIVRLLDDEGVTQSSIATALDIHRSYLNTKIKKFRETGAWPDRQTTRTRQAR